MGQISWSKYTGEQVFKKYDFSIFYIIDTFNERGKEPTEIKTPFGSLSKQSIRNLVSYGLEVTLIKEDERGDTYRVNMLTAPISKYSDEH